SAADDRGADSRISEGGIEAEDAQILSGVGEGTGDEQDAGRALLARRHGLRAERCEWAELALRVIPVRGLAESDDDLAAGIEAHVVVILDLRRADPVASEDERCRDGAIPGKRQRHETLTHPERLRPAAGPVERQRVPGTKANAGRKAERLEVGATGAERLQPGGAEPRRDEIRRLAAAGRAAAAPFQRIRRQVPDLVPDR